MLEGLVVFNGTHQAFTMEDYCQLNNISGRLIPTPESISASCGLAFKFAWSEYPKIERSCQVLQFKEIVIYQRNLAGNRKFQCVKEDRG